MKINSGWAEMGSSLVLLVIVSLCSLRVLFPSIFTPAATTSSDDVDSSSVDPSLALNIHRPIPVQARRIKEVFDGLQGDYASVADSLVAQATPLLSESPLLQNEHVTVVSGLWDYRSLDRDAYDVYGHSFEEEVDEFMQRVISVDGFKVLFMDATVYEMVRGPIDEETTRIVLISLSDLKKYMGPAYNNMKDIQTNKEWLGQAGWLANSPQAKLSSFNLVGFSKVFLLREAARANPFHTKGFLWVDGRHECLRSTPPRLPVGLINTHFDRFFATYFSYEVIGEVHGFARAPFQRFTGSPTATTAFKILKGGIFGGKLAHIELIALLFDIFMRATLSDPSKMAMGADECIWGILAYRYPRLFHLFSNDSACPSSTAYDWSCEGFENGSHHCAVFDWSGMGSSNGQVTGPVALQ